MVMSRNRLGSFRFSYCLLVTLLFAVPVNAKDSMPTRHLQEAIADVRAGETPTARANAAEHLALVARETNPMSVDDKTLADMVSLLDSPEDSVRAWVAGSLGVLGPRAKPAVPKLLSILPKSDCLHVAVSSAPFIRLAITRIVGTPPPPPGCGFSRK
jgi:hypothetical protein